MKYLIASIMAICLVAFAAQATPPPAYGGYGPGWGMEPFTWQTTSGTFSSWGLYDPNYVGGGDAWVVAWNPTTYITYAPITLELWIEMYCLQTYQYTSYKWHRLGDQLESVCFTIDGTIQSNNGQYISLTKGTDALDHLWFRQNIFGGNTPSPAPDIPIAWRARWGDGLVVGTGVRWGWDSVDPDPDDITILIDEPCDHWFQFEGCFEIAYHQPDGYYSLTMAGCPSPVM
jgi:hypothetical protein